MLFLHHINTGPLCLINFVTKKSLFSCNIGCFAPICHTATIYTGRIIQPLSKIKTLTMVKVFTNTRRLQDRIPTTTRTRKGRLGMSQGTMIREPEYGGGAHPKYWSCTEKTFLKKNCSPSHLGLFLYIYILWFQVTVETGFLLMDVYIFFFKILKF